MCGAQHNISEAPHAHHEQEEEGLRDVHVQLMAWPAPAAAAIAPHL